MSTTGQPASKFGYAAVFALGLAIPILVASFGPWSSDVRGLVTRYASTTSGTAKDHDSHADDHDGHVHGEDDHDHGESPFDIYRKQNGMEPLGHDHEETTAIELTSAGLKNIGYVPHVVAIGRFERTIRVPALVVERPGRSQLQVTAPLSGVINEISLIEGQAIEAASPLFEIRLTHEDLVSAQRDFLRTAENLAVVDREIERLRNVGEDVIAGRRILEQQYERQKLQASLLAERQALVLHGLSEPQIDNIVQQHKLLQYLSVNSPKHESDHDSCKEEHLFHVQKLAVHPGQYVEAGDLLCVLSDHCELYIEGRAFEDDALRLREVARQGKTLSAKPVSGASDQLIRGLKLLYLSDSINPVSRALVFFVSLPNMIALDRVGPDGTRFVSWKYNPGQRFELEVPVETWEDRIVLPIESVVRDGAESYVYRAEGSHFHQVAVHIEHRDLNSVVISNDGSLQVGQTIAGRGAYQMHLALKNKTSVVDPHAGHVH